MHAAPPGKTQQLTSPDQVPDGLAKSDWQSIREAYEAGRHAFQPTDTVWQARNPGQQWLTTFDNRGFIAQPKDGGWQWGLDLQSYGFGEQQRAISGTPSVKADGQRLTYSGLKVWDADGKVLPSRFETVDGRVRHSVRAAGEAEDRPPCLRLLVDERDARYPLTIDPIAQQAYLKDSNATGVNGNQVVGRRPSFLFRLVCVFCGSIFFAVLRGWTQHQLAGRGRPAYGSQKRQRLQRLPEAHLVGQHAAEAV